MRTSVLLLFVCFATLMACTEQNTGVNIRVYNDSPFTFDQVDIQPGAAGTQTYLNIGSQEHSSYKPFPFTYRYAYLQVVIAEDTLQIQPIDYVGEAQYEEGNYTFRLTVSGASGPEQLVFDFVPE